MEGSSVTEHCIVLVCSVAEHCTTAFMVWLQLQKGVKIRAEHVFCIHFVTDTEDF